jgi:ring-1,2-phenylacetyl-CoA epoxidase subunit PaaE
MVTDAIGVLDGFGVPAERVHQELFYVEDVPPPPAVHPEVEAPGKHSDVTVVLDGRSTTVSVPQATTLLEGAQRARPDLPFACKGGVCGTCRAKVTAGEADMRRNFALEPSEVAAGFVLTCQTHPVSPELTVDFDV